MADFTKFKNVNGDDLVLQDSRVDDISEKVEGIETGAEVNKINSISINDTELEPDENKCININIDDGGLEFIAGCLQINTGTGGLYVKDGELDVHCKYPLENYGRYDEQYIRLNYDNSTFKLNDDTELSVKYDGYTIVENGNGLEVANPVPDTDNANDGDVLTYDGNTDEIVWAAPQQCKIPEYTQADAGKVLAVKADGTGLEWISLVPANAVGVNNEPVGVNGDYFTVGEGQ